MREIRNLFTDPLPAGTGTWSVDNGNNKGTPATCTVTGSQLLVQGYETTSNAYVVRNVPNVPAGEYVLSVKSVSGTSPTFYGNRLFLIADSMWHILGIVPSSKLNARGVLQFDNPSTRGLRVLFQAPNKANRVAYERMLLCTAEDYEAMLAAGVEWFSGDMTIRGGLPPRRLYPHVDRRTALVVVA